MDDLQTLRGGLRWQAEFCRKSGSPTSGLVMERLAEAVGLAPPFGPLIRPWAAASGERLMSDAVPLRLLGGFHYLALSGKSPDLAALYRTDPADIDPATLSAALIEAAGDHAEDMASFMASPPQTNEVNRSLVLAAGFLTVAAETGLPLRCMELGASAGLNMNWDRFRYRFGEGDRAVEWGDPASGVDLYGDWQGEAPPLRDVQIVERLACDQSPIDVSDPDRALRLQSYIWVGQDLRMERLRAAIAVKQQTGGAPEPADAADWVERHLHPKPGVATVVYHSSFITYPPPETQARIRAAIFAAGAQATADAPVAWLSKEPDLDNLAGPDEVRLTVWPGGEQRRLAQCHPHATWVRWGV